RVHAEPDICRDAFGVVRVSGFEIGVYRQVDRANDLRNIGQHGVARDCRIRQATRKSKTCARRRECLKPEMPKIASGTNIPRIRNHKTPAFVKPSKRAAPCREIGHSHYCETSRWNT